LYQFFINLNLKLALINNTTVFISYSWQDESKKIVKKIVSCLEAAEIDFRLDERDMKPGDSISKFMDQFGKTASVIAVISDKYLRSEYCMYELLNIYRRSEMDKNIFNNKIYPIILDDAAIHHITSRQSYKDYWAAKKNSISKEIHLYEEIHLYILKLTAILSDTLAYKVDSPDDIKSIKNIISDLKKNLSKFNFSISEAKKLILKRPLNSALSEVEKKLIENPNDEMLQLMKVVLNLKDIAVFTEYEANEYLDLLNKILASRDADTYKTAFCLKIILIEEFYRRKRYLKQPELQEYLNSNPPENTVLYTFFINGIIKMTAPTLRIIQEIQNS